MATLSGGAKLAAKLLEFAKLVDNPAHLRVGFLENATYPGTSRPKLRATYRARQKAGITGAVAGTPSGTPVAMIAAIQEFGAPSRGIPPRPFFRNMIAAKSREWGPAMAGLLRQENYDARRVLALFGQGVAGQLRESIINTNTPPLKPATIARKGFSKPLVDTGHMLNSIDYEVT